jgi:hypothetical protein
MDSSTLLYLAVFFFILGAAVVAVFWAVLAIIRRLSSRGKTTGNVDPNLTEIARLMRDNQTQDLVVQMDGKTFTSSLELSPPQQRRLSFSSNVLAKWLGQPVAAEPSVQGEQSVSSAFTQQPISPEPAEIPAMASPEPIIPASDWIPAETVPSRPQNPVVPAFFTDRNSVVKPVSTQLPDVVGGILKPTHPSTPAFKSIAMQINDILQERIAGTPFEKRGITVSDGPDHGVLVTMDGQKYPGVKDVPDEAVRNIIRSAVLEWEKESKSSSK